MMITERKIWRLSLILLLALWLGGCSMQHGEDELNPLEDGISLILNISTGDISGFGTRAVESPDRFEQATWATEKIQTLRIILVDVQPGSETVNKVIHNYNTGDLGYARFDLSGIRLDHLSFSSKYNVYLIANEKALPEEIRNKFNDAALPAGSIYPKDGNAENLLEDIVVSNMANISSGSALINNESSFLTGGQSPKPIPMTEIFEITTDPRPDTNAEDIKHYMVRNFFITRAASKFSFRFNNGEEISDKTLEIKSVKISGLTKQEYLFPKNTVYSQNGTEYITTGSYQDYSSLNPKEGMEITSFSVPTGDSNKEYVFDISQKISEIGSEGVEYNPQIYFPESKGNSTGGMFRCSLSFDGTNYSAPITLPNLNALPRNTHVLINVTFHEIGFDISVEEWKPGGRTEIDITE